jgi:glucosamine kinase
VTVESSLVLAVDGGGTKTELALADREGQIAFCMCGGGTNLMNNQDWRQHLDELFIAASSLLPRVVFSVFGIPGYGEVNRFDRRLESAAAELFAGPRRVMNDVELALDGAFLDRTGIVVLAGTGSMAMARDAQGRAVRVGGWGDIFGDEGSAFWIGREALAQASRALDGRLDAVGFASAILRSLDLDTDAAYDGMMGWCYGGSHGRSAVAAVAKTVDRLAETGDRTALAVLGAAADHLSAHITATLLRLRETRPLPWSFAGSVFESRTVLEHLIAQHGEPTRPRLPPIAGGLWRAAREAEWGTDNSWVQRLGESLGQRHEDPHERNPG